MQFKKTLLAGAMTLALFGCSDNDNDNDPVPADDPRTSCREILQSYCDLSSVYADRYPV